MEEKFPFCTIVANSGHLFSFCSNYFPGKMKGCSFVRRKRQVRYDEQESLVSRQFDGDTRGINGFYSTVMEKCIRYVSEENLLHIMEIGDEGDFRRRRM